MEESQNLFTIPRYLPLISVGLGRMTFTKDVGEKKLSEYMGSLNEEDQIPGLI